MICNIVRYTKKYRKDGSCSEFPTGQQVEVLIKRSSIAAILQLRPCRASVSSQTPEQPTFTGRRPGRHIFGPACRIDPGRVSVLATDCERVSRRESPGSTRLVLLAGGSRNRRGERNPKLPSYHDTRRRCQVTSAYWIAAGVGDRG
ncbi:hypothetical protein PM082_022984 [Marasmius tenuissimus]|nr:hypothetical protein PM082_022984 [Marasmius tenuissimus]